MSECLKCNASSNASVSTEPMDMTCPAVGFQKIDVCVPVTVTPFAKAGHTVTKCCGSPRVNPENQSCPGRKNGSCSFTISQTICVEVPVEFGAAAVVGDTFVDCQTASASNICEDCDHEEL